MTAVPPTVPRRAGRPGNAAGLVRLLSGALGLSAASALLWWAGCAIPGPGSFDQRGLLEWARTADPVVVAFAAVRLAGLVLAAWIAVTGAAATVVHATRLRRRRWLRRLVDRACFPVVRRLVHGATGTLLVAATLLPGTAAGATPRDATPPAATAPALPDTPEVARLRTLPDDAAPPAAGVDGLEPGATPAAGPPADAPPSTGSSGPEPERARLRPLDEPTGGAGPAPTTTSALPSEVTAPVAPVGAAPDRGGIPTTHVPSAPAPTGVPALPDAPGDSARPGPTPGRPTPGAPAETAVLRSLDPRPAPPATASAAVANRPTPGPAPSRTWTVAPGDHLWHVAEVTLAADRGAPADVATVARYLDELIAANRDRLVLPDDPDLVFAGQVLVLPDPARIGG